MPRRGRPERSEGESLLQSRVSISIVAPTPAALRGSGRRVVPSLRVASRRSTRGRTIRWIIQGEQFEGWEDAVEMTYVLVYEKNVVVEAFDCWCRRRAAVSCIGIIITCDHAVIFSAIAECMHYPFQNATSETKPTYHSEYTLFLSWEMVVTPGDQRF